MSQTSKTIKITLVEIPSGKAVEEVYGGSDHGEDPQDGESGDSESDDEAAEEEESFVNEEGKKIASKKESQGTDNDKPLQPQA